MPTKQLTILGFMTARPGTEEALLTQIDALVASTRAEPGCINYDFHQHASEPHRFVFYENFADQAAFDFHFAQPYTQEWIAFAEARGAAFDIQRWTMLTQPAHTREAPGEL
jgi:quinol monooxygenase YgiN